VSAHTRIRARLPHTHVRRRTTIMKPEAGRGRGASRIFAAVAISVAALAAPALGAAVSDWNGDGARDILWRYETTGRNYVWFMNGLAQTGGTDVTPVADTAWRIAGVGDFNGDRQNDILWRNQTT